MFDLNDSLRGVQIIDYCIMLEEDWFVLIGIIHNPINPAVFEVEGIIQLYSTTRDVSQAIEGHAAAFAELKLDSGESPTKLFTWAARTVSGAKVQFVFPGI
jgi:clathrin heavy chain